MRWSVDKNTMINILMKSKGDTITLRTPEILHSQVLSSDFYWLSKSISQSFP